MDPILDRSWRSPGAHNWFRENINEIEKAISDWRIEVGMPPIGASRKPFAHILWRVLRREDHGDTLRQVLQATWPKKVEPVEGKAIGNFLATPNGFELAKGGAPCFQYPGMNPTQQRLMIQEYTKLGYNWLPLSAWDNWPNRGTAPLAYNYMNDPQGFVDQVILPLKAVGINVLFMLLTEPVDGSKIDFNRASNLVDRMMPIISPHVQKICLGWEPYQDIIPNGESNLVLLDRMRRHMTAGQELLWHGGNHRWGPDDIGEWPFWEDPRSADGLLYQVPHTDSINAIERDLFELKPMADGTKGIVGRVMKLKKTFYLFEHSRDLDHYNGVVNIIKDDDRISGWM
jgi:hypothetical protein